MNELLRAAQACGENGVSKFDFNFMSGVVIKPAEDFSKILYPFWHAETNPFTYDFEKYKDMLQKLQREDATALDDLIKAGAITMNGTEVFSIKFEVIPGCVYEYKDESTEDSWYGFLESNKSAIKTYIKETRTDRHLDVERRYFRLFENSSNEVGIIIYYVEDKISYDKLQHDPTEGKSLEDYVKSYAAEYGYDAYYATTSTGVEF